MKAILQKIANEPAVVLGVVIAAVNATTNQTWQGYAASVAVALLRFLVTGPLTDSTPNV